MPKRRVKLPVDKPWFDLFQQYRKPGLWSLLLHVGLILTLWFSTFSFHKPKTNPKVHLTAADTQPIKAISVDNAAVEQMVERIRLEKRQQKAQQQARQVALQQQAQAARKLRLREEQAARSLQQKNQALLSQTARLQQEKRQQLTKMQQDYQKQQAALQAQLRKGEKELSSLKQKLDKQAQSLAQKEKQVASAQTKQSVLEQQAKAQRAAIDAQVNAEINHYKALIVRTISQQWILPKNVAEHLSCYFEITLGDAGEVMAVKLLRSSGDAVLDRSAQSAIYKSSPLPLPNSAQARALFKTIRLTVKPENVGRP